MKFAMRDERLANILNASNTTAWTIAAFFFHDRGSEIQKSLTGMFQGLLGSILRQLPSLDFFVVPFYLELVRAQRTRSPTWNLETLVDAVLSIVKQRKVHVRMLLFLDALDEHHGDNVLLAELLKSLVDSVDQSWVHHKLCLASRPWTTFQQYFGHCPGFAIHDHTQLDIRTYIESRVDIGTQVPRLNDDRIGLLRIVDLVAQRALGIFIWVRLVMDRISKGVRDGTPYAALEEKVKSMPLELRALYADTLRRIDPDYSSEAYIMLQIALCSLVPLPVDVFMASVELAQDERFSASSTPTLRFHNSAESLLSMGIDLPVETLVSHKSRLTSRSGGLLELTSSATTAGDTLESGDNEGSLVVQFIHQTVREYFLTVPRHEIGLLGVPHDTLSEDGNMFLVKSCVAQDEWITCIKRDLFLYASRAMESNQDQAGINRVIEFALLENGHCDLKWFLLQQSQSLQKLIMEVHFDKALSRLAVAKGFPEYVTFNPVDADLALVHIAAARTNFDRLSWDTDNRKAIKHLLAIGYPVDAIDCWIVPHASLDPTLAMFRDRFGITPLGVTLLVDKISAGTRFLQAKELLESGANPNADISSDRFVLTLLQLCVCQRDADIVRLLLQHGADANVNICGWDLLHLAFIRGDRAVIQVLLDAGLSGKSIQAWPEFRTVQELFLASGLSWTAPSGGLSGKIARIMYHNDFDSLIRTHRDEHGVVPESGWGTYFKKTVGPSHEHPKIKGCVYGEGHSRDR